MSLLHRVSAYAPEARLILAQEKISEKRNEITAIPKRQSIKRLRKMGGWDDNTLSNILTQQSSGGDSGVYGKCPP